MSDLRALEESAERAVISLRAGSGVAAQEVLERARRVARGPGSAQAEGVAVVVSEDISVMVREASVQVGRAEGAWSSLSLTRRPDGAWQAEVDDDSWVLRPDGTVVEPDRALDEMAEKVERAARNTVVSAPAPGLADWTGSAGELLGWLGGVAAAAVAVAAGGGLPPVAVGSQLPRGPEEPRARACPRCHASLLSDALFCSRCGAPAHPVCPRCRAELPDGVRFCHRCGSDLESDPSTSP